MDKKVKIKLRHDTEAEYEKVKSTFLPLAGEVCLVRTSYGLRAKIGDGQHYFEELPYDDIKNSIVINGYFLNDKFYTDSTYQTEFEKCDRHVYIDCNNGKQIFYVCDGTNYFRISPQEATETIPGVVKLYTAEGQNEDGTMTQKAITNGISDIKFAVDPTIDECLVLNLPW